MLKRLLFVVVVSYGAYTTYNSRSVEHDPGVLVKNTPHQSEIDSAQPFTYKGYQVTPLADFNLDARILGIEHYSLGRESDLSPVDLALGWGPMSDSAVISQLSISQSGRFYHWSASRLPVPREAISSHSANMHMVPADSRVEKELMSLREGEVVRIAGYLIRADAPDGWHWVSSLTREDSGNGACELVWVREVSRRMPTL
ncbi:hypothetical protein [Sedimenticola thiotaurini]|uniref:Uncharacterized protein n=1 Tax=Sedimenticola thiotaurini TaxID=1543721 RepID=A0A0F7JZB7_9GAMM|nr:hypothetical protein [Sedimenticola thiotaurini]AKH20240.1 hypothetical protein AAY24_07645 [Sedimenticola thiotaurini]